MTQRSFINTTIWNEPLPLTLVGTVADPNHSNNLPVVMDPLMFLAGAVPSSLNAYPAAAAAAAALMPVPAVSDQQQLTAGVGDSEATGGASASAAAAQVATGSAGARSSVASSSSGASSALSTAMSADQRDRDHEANPAAKPSLLRLMQAQNGSLARVSRSMSNTAHALEVGAFFAGPVLSYLSHAKVEHFAVFLLCFINLILSLSYSFFRWETIL